MGEGLLPRRYGILSSSLSRHQRFHSLCNYRPRIPRARCLCGPSHRRLLFDELGAHFSWSRFREPCKRFHQWLLELSTLRRWRWNTTVCSTDDNCRDEGFHWKRLSAQFLQTSCWKCIPIKIDQTTETTTVHHSTSQSNSLLGNSVLLRRSRERKIFLLPPDFLSFRKCSNPYLYQASILLIIQVLVNALFPVFHQQPNSSFWTWGPLRSSRAFFTSASSSAGWSREPGSSFGTLDTPSASGAFVALAPSGTHGPFGSTIAGWSRNTCWSRGSRDSREAWKTCCASTWCLTTKRLLRSGLKRNREFFFTLIFSTEFHSCANVWPKYQIDNWSPLICLNVHLCDVAFRSLLFPWLSSKMKSVRDGCRHYNIE